MKTYALIFQDTVIKKVEIELVFVPGFPKMDFIGLSSSKGKELQEKLKIWLRLLGLSLPRNKRLVFEVRPALSNSPIHGLDLSIWLLLIGHILNKKPVKMIYSGDFSLLGEAVENLFLEKLLREQNLKSLVSTHSMKGSVKDYQNLHKYHFKHLERVNLQLELNELFKNKKILFLSDGSKEDKKIFQCLLENYQNQEQKLLQRLSSKILFPPYMDSIYYIDDLEYWSKSSLDKLSFWLRDWDIQSLFVKIKICPCGKKAQIKERVLCQKTKFYCSSYIKHIQANFIAQFDCIISLKEFYLKNENGKISIKCAESFPILSKKYQWTSANKSLFRLQLESK